MSFLKYILVKCNCRQMHTVSHFFIILWCLIGWRINRSKLEDRKDTQPPHKYGMYGAFKTWISLLLLRIWWVRMGSPAGMQGSLSCRNFRSLSNSVCLWSAISLSNPTWMVHRVIPKIQVWDFRYVFWTAKVSSGNGTFCKSEKKTFNFATLE